MKKLVCILAIAFCFASQPAMAYRDSYGYGYPYNGFSPYFSLSGEAWIPAHSTSNDISLLPTETHYDGGVGISGAFGAEIGPLFRLENELSYRYAPERNGGGDTWAFAWMLNGWLQAKNQTPVTPYIGGGFGLGRGHVVSAGPLWDGDMTGVAYQVGCGLDILLDRRTSLDLGYRYFGISDSSNNNAAGGGLAGSTILAGVRVRF
jgi:opacity protein-like surface antigen